MKRNTVTGGILFLLIACIPHGLIAQQKHKLRRDPALLQTIESSLRESVNQYKALARQLPPGQMPPHLGKRAVDDSCQQFLDQRLLSRRTDVLI